MVGSGGNRSRKINMNEHDAMVKVRSLYDQNPSDFLLLEIGANDGYCCDRMWNFVNECNPNAIMVEPTPDYFAALKQNYEKYNNVKFENVAISDKEETVTMTYIPREDIVSEKVTYRLEASPQLWKEHWAGGLGSFYVDKNNLGDPNLKQYQKKFKSKQKL